MRFWFTFHICYGWMGWCNTWYTYFLRCYPSTICQLSKTTTRYIKFVYMYEGYYLCTSYIFFFLLLGKYYLVDAGYPLRKWYLPPYKGQRYHLLDFRRAGRGNHIEKRFNYVHSSLRSAIEQTYECGRINGKFWSKCHLMTLSTKETL